MKKVQKDAWVGMHNGSVAGKGFERSRRARKSHTSRRAEISSRDRSKK